MQLIESVNFFSVLKGTKGDPGLFGFDGIPSCEGVYGERVYLIS